MGSRPKARGPTAQERALASDSAERWNDYVTRYVPVENELVKRSQVTPDKLAAAQGLANADARMSEGQMRGQMAAAMASQGAAPSSGRAALGGAALGDASATASGGAQAHMVQGVHDQEQGMRQNMSAFGRDLQGQTQLGLASAANRATDAKLSAFGRKLDQRNFNLNMAMDIVGAGAGAAIGQMNAGGRAAGGGLSAGWNLSGEQGVRAFSQQDRMLRQQTRGM